MFKIFRGNKVWSIVICFLFCILCFLFIPSLFIGLKNFTLNILLLPVKLVSGAGNIFQGKGDLIAENKSLYKQINELNLRIQRYNEIVSENDRLRELNSFKRKINFDTVSAEIIARNPNDWISSLIIDKGTNDGIEKHSAVCSSNGLIGKVVESKADTSSVMLVSHPGFRAGGMLKNSRISGVVAGAGKGKVKMLYIPIDTEVKEGAMVITSGYSKVFPKGILIGRVVSVNKSKTGLYKNAEIKPAANPFEHEEVLCIK